MFQNCVSTENEIGKTPEFLNEPLSSLSFLINYCLPPVSAAVKQSEI